MLPRAPKQFVGSALELVSNLQAEDTIRFRVSDFGTFASPVTPLKVKRQERIQAIMNAGNQVLSGYQLAGTGKIGFQLLRETYRLSLKGESGAYAGLWTPVLEQSMIEDVTVDDGGTARPGQIARVGIH